MLKHYFLIIFRNIKRNKSAFFINLVGLSTGLACALLIILWVEDEFTIDKFHEKDDQLYQVMLNHQRPDGIQTGPDTPGLLAQALTEEMPEVEYTVSVIPSYWFGSEGILALDDVQLKVREQYVSKDYFHIFSYPLLQGNIDQVLADKNSVLLSDKTAMKLFNTTENVVGKTIEWKRDVFKLNFSGLYTISGIFREPPANSTDHFDLIFSYDLFFEKMNKNLIKWSNQNPCTYLVLKTGTDIKQFNAKIADFIKTKDKQSLTTLFVQQYSQRYLHGNYENGIPSGGRILYVRLFLMIAAFILFIACINYMNLSTARASRRMKEIGIKKVIGANRKVLIAQHLGESILLSLLSLILAILLVELLLPQFNHITGKQLSLNFNLNMILTFGGITFMTGLVSGSYPAFYLSGFNPVSVLKGKLNTSLSEIITRKGLVVVQFIISVILIVSVITVYKQITFIQTKNLGIEKDNVICFKKDGKLNESYDTFLHELKKFPGIINVSNSDGNFTGNHSSTIGGIIAEDKEHQEKLRFALMDVNYDFFETVGIKTLEGRTFSEKFGSEASKIIFNETGIRLLGIKNPIGKTVQLWGEDRQIIGIVKDFHYESFYHEVKPCFFRVIDPDKNYGSNIWVKIRAGSARESLARIQKLYKEFNPGLVFEYKFLDDDYQALYKSENRIATLSRYFAGIAIIISCLGLFGLASFTAERRCKEIGVRKVLGSSTSQIVYLLSGDFTRIVLVSILIALPASYFITKSWLSSFAYRIDLQFWYFLSAGLFTLFITICTVGVQAVKAALANPVESLRYE